MCTALAEKPGLSSSIQVKWLTTAYNSSSRGFSASTSAGTCTHVHMPIHGHNIHIVENKAESDQGRYWVSASGFPMQLHTHLGEGQSWWHLTDFSKKFFYYHLPKKGSGSIFFVL